MNGLLGKIVEVSPIPAKNFVLSIKLKPACLLPERCAVPSWLADQTLTIQRVARDEREVGGIGDSIVLTAAESEPYLQPLVVEPAVCYGSLPETIHVTLRWAKDDKEPEYEVLAGSGAVKGKFAKEGGLWQASFPTANLFGYKPAAPAAITVKVDKHEATCTLLDADSPTFSKMSLPHGPAYRLENAWYAIDISLSAGAGAVEKLVEKGRGVDHFAKPEEIIHLNQEGAGHLDRVRVGSGWDWFDKMRDTAVSSVGARSGGGSTRITLESALDDGQNIRTSVVHTLFDALPLLTIQRDYQKTKPAASDKKEDTPKEPVDGVTTMGLGFRASWLRERGQRSGSRMLYGDQDRLAIVRSAVSNDFSYHPYWKMSGGWCLVEHPGRKEHMLYLFDAKDAPNFSSWAGARTITLEPSWSLTPLSPGESLGITLGLAAGEICGAGAQGAWVACRAVKNGQTQIGIVARLRETLPGSASSEITLGGETREVKLSPLFIPGIGTLHTAVAECDQTDSRAVLTAQVAGIASRPIQA